ncbi:MAG: type II secretion system protein GspC [Gammaproteobacteria bacterium]|nr:type II secretion system protein GspC [Gammaproteobacteria bacterium]
MHAKEALHQFIARTQLLERLPWALATLLVIALCFRMAELTWRIVPITETEEAIPPEPPLATAQIAKPAVEISISQASLFGRVDIAAAPKVEEQVVVPETRLNLTLLGVIASSAVGTAKAIISDASGNEEFYSVGMQVPGGASLEEIHADYVMLKRNNRMEILRLPVDETILGQPGSGGPGMQPPAMSMAQQGRHVLPPSGMGSDNRSTGALLHEYRDALNQDPQSVMDLVRAEPVREGDRLIGYRVSPGRDRQLLSRFGLRAGDVVTMVNGVRLDNPVKGLEIIQNLQTAGQVNIEVMRNGVTQGFSFAVE